MTEKSKSKTTFVRFELPDHQPGIIIITPKRHSKAFIGISFLKGTYIHVHVNIQSRGFISCPKAICGFQAKTLVIGSNALPCYLTLFDLYQKNTI